MATTYDIQRRRGEFTSYSFDEMVEKIIDLEGEVENAKDEVSDLEKQVAELEAAAS